MIINISYQVTENQRVKYLVMKPPHCVYEEIRQILQSQYPIMIFFALNYPHNYKSLAAEKL